VEIKYLIIVILALILASLGKALFHLSRNRTPEESKSMARALSWRIGLSVLLFALLILSYYAGWIQPNR
jgi:Protein of unknown function (DUF2909)